MIYFDNAATSFPKPAASVRAATEAITRWGANPGRGSHPLALRASDEVFRCRERAAKLFSLSAPERVIFTSSATHSLNMALFGMLRAGEHAICSQLEHNSVLRPLTALGARGVTFTPAAVDFFDDEKTLRNFESCLRRNTRVVVCTAASNVCGFILPIRKIHEFCQTRGLLFILDASQAAGHIPIEAADCDILCTAGHKGLYGTHGTGLMVLCGDALPQPLLYGGTGVNSAEAFQPAEPPERYESGTLNLPGIAALSAGCVFAGNGMEAGMRHDNELMQSLKNELRRNRRIHPVIPWEVERCVSVLSFNVEGQEAGNVEKWLGEHGVCTRAGLHCAPLAHRALGTPSGAVRLSPGRFNTLREASEVCALLRKMP